ncbi:MAG TPA: cyclic nucleotide-binding domain-containing protein [Terriglobales bacterium]|nr:cyclic nucleotide-binding domain-containing protein [Terriglobales bacterium]
MATRESVSLDLTLVASPELQHELEQIGTPVSRPRGTVVFRRGEPNSGAFLIRKGGVRLFLRNARGIVISDRWMGPRSLLGLPSTFNQRAYSLDAEALEDVELISISSPALHDFVRDCSRGREVLEILAREVSAIQILAGQL